MNEFQTTYCPVCGDLDLTGVDDRNVMISSLCEETGEMRGNLPIVVETAAVRLDEGDGALRQRGADRHPRPHLRLAPGDSAGDVMPCAGGAAVVPTRDPPEAGSSLALQRDDRDTWRH